MCDRPDLSDGDPDRPMILLLVEDEALREALRFSLETDGYMVRAPADTHSCLNCSDCGAAACVVIDDGDATVPPPTAGRPTIVLTGDAQRLARRGVTGVTLVEKPLLDDKLGRELSTLLARAAPGLQL
ncbi:nucleoside transporter [Caulobacter vibrioides]|uniref:Nucleoside transporter n=1 Tax=Caulobacter vibrioides TaxID=155892 RepID=A0A290MQN3_CAUVI|nr:nucleoside transporter [Caulobacter vibrioides]ATC34302.1 nucleoside transporter [Caulobacter vibrioides]